MKNNFSLKHKGGRVAEERGIEDGKVLLITISKIPINIDF